MPLYIIVRTHFHDSILVEQLLSLKSIGIGVRNLPTRITNGSVVYTEICNNK